MTDRVYPSSKPNGTTAKPAIANGNGGTAKPKLPPPPKSNLYDPTNNPYRLRQQQQLPKPHRRRRRRCLCRCCFWSILIIIAVLLLAAIAGCILYLLFRPHRPTFSVTALKFSQFNLTADDDSTAHLTAKLNLTLTARNPNKKLTFIYDSISITCLSSSSNPQIQIANGSFPDFVSSPNNITIIRSSLYSNDELLEPDSVNSVRADLKKKKGGLPLKIVMDLGVRVTLNSLKSKKIGIRINCDGIHSLIPDGMNKNSTVSATIPDAKCKVDLRIKIWKYWTF